jgi:uncharacterized protein DUF1264
MSRLTMVWAFGLAVVASGSSYAQGRPAPPQASELPPAKLSLWLDGFHMRDGHSDEQANIHHFCSTPENAPIQCTLWSGFGKDAKLVGIEYIIDGKTFAALPEQEKRLWHSHVYEVTSGALVAPGMSEKDEAEFLKKAIGTYGKTWHTWDEKMNASVPVGRPELMMSITRDGVLHPQLIQQRDQELGVNTRQLREDRAKAIIQLPKIEKGADVGEGGRSCTGGNAQPQTRQGHPRR